jgi:hypothetical protein
MSTITPVVLLDGAVASLDDVNGNFDQFTEINGKLEAVNVGTIDRKLDSAYIQQRAVSGGKMVGGTANLDYFNGIRYVYKRVSSGSEQNKQAMGYRSAGYLTFLTSKSGWANLFTTYKDGFSPIDYTFPGVSDAAAPGNTKLAIAIPGAATTFYVPYSAYVLVTWQITWTSDAARLGRTAVYPRDNGEDSNTPKSSEFPQPNVAIRFYVDGAEHNAWSTTRESREAMFAHPVVVPFSDMERNISIEDRIQKHKLRDRYKSRYWSGHAWLGVKTKGFHTVSLRVISSHVVRQTRVRVRNIKVLHFKAPE